MDSCYLYQPIPLLSSICFSLTFLRGGRHSLSIVSKLCLFPIRYSCLNVFIVDILFQNIPGWKALWLLCYYYLIAVSFIHVGVQISLSFKGVEQFRRGTNLHFKFGFSHILKFLLGLFDSVYLFFYLLLNCVGMQINTFHNQEFILLNLRRNVLEMLRNGMVRKLSNCSKLFT